MQVTLLFYLYVFVEVARRAYIAVQPWWAIHALTVILAVYDFEYSTSENVWNWEILLFNFLLLHFLFHLSEAFSSFFFL